MTIPRLIPLVVFSILCGPTVCSPSLTVQRESASADRIYVQQLKTLHSQAQAFLSKTERPHDSTGALNLAEEGLAISTLVGRLGEEARRTELERMKFHADQFRKHPAETGDYLSTKNLLLVSDACTALDLMVDASTQYSDTGDRTFLGLARSADAIVADIRKVLPH